jgi:hypothetical protein
MGKGDHQYSTLTTHLPCAEVCGEHPIAQSHSQDYDSTMNTLLIIVVLLLLFGGGGGYYYSRRR